MPSVAAHSPSKGACVPASAFFTHDSTAGVDAFTAVTVILPFAAVHSTRGLSPLGAQASSAAFFLAIPPATSIEPSTPSPSARHTRSSIVSPSTDIEPTRRFAPAGPEAAAAVAAGAALADAVAAGAAVAA